MDIWMQQVDCFRLHILFAYNFLMNRPILIIFGFIFKDFLLMYFFLCTRNKITSSSSRNVCNFNSTTYVSLCHFFNLPLANVLCALCFLLMNFKCNTCTQTGVLISTLPGTTICKFNARRASKRIFSRVQVRPATDS